MSCILEYQGAVRLHWSIIELAAAILGKNAYEKLVTRSENECQRSVNNFWFCISNNLTAMERRKPIINPSAAPIGKNACDDISSASYNSAPAERQQFLSWLW